MTKARQHRRMTRTVGQPGCTFGSASSRTPIRDRQRKAGRPCPLAGSTHPSVHLAWPGDHPSPGPGWRSFLDVQAPVPRLRQTWLAHRTSRPPRRAWRRRRGPSLSRPHPHFQWSLARKRPDSVWRLLPEPWPAPVDRVRSRTALLLVDPSRPAGSDRQLMPCVNTNIATGRPSYMYLAVPLSSLFPLSLSSSHPSHLQSTSSRPFFLPTLQQPPT